MRSTPTWPPSRSVFGRHHLVGDHPPHSSQGSASTACDGRLDPGRGKRRCGYHPGRDVGLRPDAVQHELHWVDGQPQARQSERASNIPTLVPRCGVGTVGPHPGIRRRSGSCAALGACVVEKHFTDDTGRVGPDHGFSLDPRCWREMVERTRESRTRSALPLSEWKRMNGRRSSRSAGPFVPRESLQWEPYWRGQILSRCDRAPQVPYLLPDSTMLWVQRSGATSVWASL